MSAKLTKRDDSLDIARGLLIIAVVLGHSLFVYTGVLYWFHVPGFFIIGGLLYSGKKVDVKRLAKTLFIPTAAFAVIDIISRLHTWPKLRNTEDVVELIFSHMLSGQYITGVYWFIPVFFLTKVIFDFMYRRLGEKYTGLIVVGLFVVAHAISSEFIPAADSHFEINTKLATKLPWAVDVVLFTLFYFWVGFLARRIHQKIKSWKFLGLSLGLCVGFTAAYFIIDFNFDIETKFSYYKNVPLDAVVPVVFTFAILSISWVVTKIKYLKQLLVQTGYVSLPIMFLHVPISSRLLDLKHDPLTYTVIGVLAPLGIMWLASKSKALRLVFNGGR